MNKTIVAQLVTWYCHRQHLPCMVSLPYQRTMSDGTSKTLRKLINVCDLRN